MENSDFTRYADDIVGKAFTASESFKNYNQAAVDRIVKAVFEAAFDARLELAEKTYSETGIGILEHKVIKNVWASLLVYENIKNQRTVGEISHDPYVGLTEIARPHGPILALTPLTNPTSTTIFKTLIAMKTRNPLIFSAHGAAKRCSRYTVELLYNAALAAGAPENCMQWISKRTPGYLHCIMRHRKLALIIATGTRQIVREAYISGKPVIGIGPGNVPTYVHETADFPLAADYIVKSKAFDNGTVCASEQALVVEEKNEKKLRLLLEQRGCYFCSDSQAEKLGTIAFDEQNTLMRADVVGRSAQFLADKAGFAIPESTRLLIAPCKGIGPGYPLSYEILTTILTYYVVRTYKQAMDACVKLNSLGGQGHTLSIYANNDKVIEDFTGQVSAGRICVNTPATHGAIGGTYNSLNPSFTLSCGTQAGNIFTDNITTTHLLNIYRVARRRPNMKWFAFSQDDWSDPGLNAKDIINLYNKNY